MSNEIYITSTKLKTNIARLKIGLSNFFAKATNSIFSLPLNLMSQD